MKSGYSKLIMSLLALFCYLSGANGQKVELGVLLGGSYYYGDVVNDFIPSTIGGAGGVFIRLHVNDRIKIKGFGGYAKIGGADSLSKSEFQQNRNSDFTSDVLEGSVQLEYCFVNDNMRGRRVRNRVIPYVFAGLGAFFFSPKTTISDPVTGEKVEVNLSSYQTNGVKYDQIAICIPFGAGVKFKLNQNLSIGLEMGPRYTMTSYLDDIDGNSKYLPVSEYEYGTTSLLVADRSKFIRNDDGSTAFSQPGNWRGKMGNIKDLYFIYGLTVGYRLGSGGGGGGGGYGGRAIRCPRFY